MTIWSGGDLGERHRDSFGIFLQLVENRVVTELEHEVEFTLSPEHFDEIDEVWVFEVFQHPDFSEGNFLDERVILALHKLLDGHQVPGVPGSALVDHPVGALAYLAQLLVSLHQSRRSPGHLGLSLD